MKKTLSKKTKSNIITIALSVLISVFVITIFYQTPYGLRLFAALSQNSEVKNYTKLMVLDEVIADKYIGQYDSEQSMDLALKAYVSSLGDDYSSYFNKSDFARFTENLEGDYKGIGVTISSESGVLVIKNVQKDSPAKKAGIKKGDILISVDGVNYTGESLNAAIADIKDTAKGGSVKLGIIRDNKLLELTAQVDDIKADYVNYRVDNSGIAYIRIKTFGKSITEPFKKAIDDIQKQGAKGLILDLRSNPGGALDSAVDIADILLPEGTILSSRGKNGEEEKYVSDEKEIKLPMCVLINEGSASASEVVSGALRDYDKAVLIGKNSFGKGVVQTVFDFGDKTGFSITVAKYYTPSGECIHGKGIAPDIEVDMPEDGIIAEDEEDVAKDAQLIAAIKQMKAMIK